MSLTAPSRPLRFKKVTIPQTDNVELHEVKQAGDVELHEIKSSEGANASGDNVLWLLDQQQRAKVVTSDLSENKVTTRLTTSGLTNEYHPTLK
jgi:hypothetical protein